MLSFDELVDVGHPEVAFSLVVTREDEATFCVEPVHFSLTPRVAR